MPRQTKKHMDQNNNVVCIEYDDFSWIKKEYDLNNNEIYNEYSNGYWYKAEYDQKNNQIYSGDSTGIWYKWEYDKEDNEIYFEDASGNIVDNRPKPVEQWYTPIDLTLDEFHNLERNNEGKWYAPAGLNQDIHNHPEDIDLALLEQKRKLERNTMSNFREYIALENEADLLQAFKDGDVEVKIPNMVWRSVYQNPHNNLICFKSNKNVLSYHLGLKFRLVKTMFDTTDIGVVYESLFQGKEVLTQNPYSLELPWIPIEFQRVCDKDVLVYSVSQNPVQVVLNRTYRIK